MKEIFITDGSGYWSQDSKSVIVTKIAISYIDEGSIEVSTFGELRAYFDAKTWTTYEDGLIYTDSRWIREFRIFLKQSGFSNKAVNDVNYSEQGMQGNSYVSMDIGKHFLSECSDLINFLNKRNITVDLKMEYN